MASVLKLSGSVRISSLQLGTTKWREGGFEINEKENKVSLLVWFTSGGLPKTFQLNQNVKKVNLGPKQHQCRLQVILKDANIFIDKAPLVMAQKFKDYLEKLRMGKQTALKQSQGSVSFGGVLGNRAIQNESSQQIQSIERQTPPRRLSLDETSLRKHLTSPNRGSSTPVRTGLSENSNNKTTSDSSRKFLASCKEKQQNLKQAEENRISGAMPLQTSSFYSSRVISKDYCQGNSMLERSVNGSQVQSTKRSLGFVTQSVPFKKVKLSHDYTGWTKPKNSSLVQSQPQLQGFSNLGNTCYMNAILQSLFCLQSFSNDLLKGIPWKRVPPNSLLRRFSHLLAKKDLCSPDVKKELLKKVKSAISTTAERFSGYMQNDAHEFLSQCLDQLKEDVEKVNKSCKSDFQPLEEVQMGRPGEEVAASRIYTCPVVANVEFEVQHNITCKVCGETVTKREQFNDLSIDLPRRKQTLPLRSIQDSLDLFFRMEEIEYSCEKCSGKSASVSHKFSKLPRILILHLKRYSYNAHLSLNSKLGQQVLIPKYLTLLSHCTESTRPPLGIGWSAQNAVYRTLKTSQALNSNAFNQIRKYSMKQMSPGFVIFDSDSDEEVTRKAACRSHRRSESLPEEDRLEKSQQSITIENSETSYEGINDEEMLAAVLEMSQQENVPSTTSGLGVGEPTSSPDTGFGDVDGNDFLKQGDSFDTDGPTAEEVSNLINLAKDLDENKENQTPEEAQGEFDWVQQYNLEQDREEQELQQALAQSLQDQEAREMKEEDDLIRATELSLQEFNNSMHECSDEDSGNEDILDMDYTVAEAEELKRNAETGDLPNSFRLVSVVSHIGSSSSSGHYISDVYDIKKQSWLTYNDLDVTKTQVSSVQRDRDRSGYIFFYMHKDIFEELLEAEKISSGR
ncbi:ubiquitin carboxyl-terminal hydrolase 37 isoform X2 [Erpetoichthys calabaricus]|uniref:ubiquitin carboxyl-terminal hydrolase 37 isoform X2 n=1 Tax=Erpetoichthys calabaricus TaxID=27687 RepID=UPI0022347C42|nr:ubiquitin carboxyl-terminal hydrolase 37 isoform X2 [Erpetoichthys calabaricus]